MDPKKRSMEGLRDIIWEQIDKVQKKEVDLERAKLVLQAADTIINSYKVEVAHAIAFKKGPVAGLALPDKKTIEAEGKVVDEAEGVETKEEPKAEAKEEERG